MTLCPSVYPVIILATRLYIRILVQGLVSVVKCKPFLLSFEEERFQDISGRKCIDGIIAEIGCIENVKYSVNSFI